jgi:hypothetical protein
MTCLCWYRKGRVYNSNPFVISALHHSSVVFLIEESGKYFTVGWVGHRVGLVGTENPASIGIRSPYLPGQSYTNNFIPGICMAMYRPKFVLQVHNT